MYPNLEQTFLKFIYYLYKPTVTKLTDNYFLRARKYFSLYFFIYLLLQKILRTEVLDLNMMCVL